MRDMFATDLCIIGAGSGGLSVAAAAARMGARTVLIERRDMGGARLNAGCVPSKALLAAGQVAETIRNSARFGVNGHAPEIRYADVQAHVRNVIASIAPDDSAERITELGCTVLKAQARFVTPKIVQAGPIVVRARRFVVATGSRPLVPDVPGIETAPYFTNETIFENSACPDHLIVIGGGTSGCELAQAHRRLSSRVTLLEKAHILPNDDPELTAVVKMQLLAEGITILEGIEIVHVRGRANRITVLIKAAGAEREMDCSHLLVTTGRKPNVEELGLEDAGIAYSAVGIKVDERLRTTNRKVYAIGDVAGLPTHVADHHARVVIRNALLRLPARLDDRAIPWTTFTDPELAHVGLTERQARERHGRVRILRLPFSENDRAQAARRTSGQIKVVATARGDILGASIVGAHAGELLQPWILAIEQRLKIGALARMTAPHPTLGEISRRVAASFFTPALSGGRTRKLVQLLSRFG